jgi:hypothetical protein
MGCELFRSTSPSRSEQAIAGRIAPLHVGVRGSLASGGVCLAHAAARRIARASSRSHAVPGKDAATHDRDLARWKRIFRNNRRDEPTRDGRRGGLRRAYSGVREQSAGGADLYVEPEALSSGCTGPCCEDYDSRWMRAAQRRFSRVVIQIRTLATIEALRALL